MNYIVLTIPFLLFTNCYPIETTESLSIIENPPSPTTSIEINSGTYLQAGGIFNGLFTEIEERFPDYRRLVKDIAELESSEQLLLEEGMDVFAYEIELSQLKCNRKNMYETMIEPEIQKIDKILLLITKIPGLNATQASFVLEELGMGV